MRYFPLDGRFETTPCDQEPLIGTCRLHRAEELAERRMINGRLLRLDLNTDFRRAEAEISAAGQNVDAAIRTCGTVIGHISLRAQDRVDKPLETMSLEPAHDERRDFVASKLLV